MRPSHRTFSAKLYELEREYEQMQRWIRICQDQEHSDILLEAQKLKDENTERDASLEKTIIGSSSPGVAELADAQLSYRRKVERGLRQVLDESPTLEDCAEKMALYAEYAIDFATQAMRHAMLSVFTATDLQLRLEEQWADLKNNIITQEVKNHE